MWLYWVADRCAGAVGLPDARRAGEDHAAPALANGPEGAQLRQDPQLSVRPLPLRAAGPVCAGHRGVPSLLQPVTGPQNCMKISKPV